MLARDGCEGKHLAEAGANRAAIVAAVTGDDEDNLVVCQMAKHHFDVPRTIARVNNPRNEELFRHLGVDEIISPTRMALAAIEQDIPVHELLHLAQLEGGELELIEAQIGDELAGHRTSARPTSRCPTAARCSCSSGTTWRSRSGPRRSSRPATRCSPSRAPTARRTSTASSSATSRQPTPPDLPRTRACSHPGPRAREPSLAGEVPCSASSMPARCVTLSSNAHKT